jgi:long-chain acyl-CoA synthetase
VAARETLGAGANLADEVRRSARERPDSDAVRHAGGRISWAELDADVDALAAALRKDLRLGRGARVALALSNTPAFVTSYFAILRAGLVAVPLNPGYTAPEMARLLGEADAAAVLTEPATHPVLEEAVADTRRALVDGAGYDALLASGRSAPPPPDTTGGEDLAVLLFTSGTSGRPRGARLSHRALMANHEQCLRLEPTPMVADDVVLLVLPLFHIYGLNAGLGMVARTGATALLVERFDPRECLELVRREGVTNIPGAPPMYVAWAGLAEAGEVDLAAALHGVRMLVSGASPLPPAVLEQVRTAAGVDINEGYGLTETAPVLTSSIGTGRVKPGSVGRPIPGVELRLLDERGDEVSDDDAGEISVRGDNLFSGYWPDGTEGPDEQGWYATGDVAYADEDGDLFLVDRRKELVLVSGFNVYPREIEDVIATHPDVAEVAVIGLPHPYTGEAVKAFVVARPGVTLRPQEVTAFTESRLARFKRPTIVEVVAALPHSATGKVAKGRLRAGEIVGDPSAQA